MSGLRPPPILDTLFGKRTMFLAWLGALVLSFGWLHALWIYVPAAHGGRWFATGIALLVLGCRGGDPGRQRLARSESWLLGVASLVGLLFLPRPYDLGPALLLGCALLILLPVPRAMRHLLLPGLWVAGITLVLQAALLPVLFIVAARLHDAPFLAPLVYGPLKLIAPETIRTGATLQMVTPVDSVPLTPSWEKVALIPAALCAVAFMTLVFAHRRGLSRLAGLVSLGLLYAWARLLILFLVVSRFHDPRVFWDPAALFVGFLPFALVLAAWWGFASESPAVPELPGEGAARGEDGGFRGRTAAGALLCVAGWTFFWGYQDPGTRKPGRVLIDEGHSDWEWTTQPFDTEWYGARSGYNYYCLADYWNHFYHVETHREPLTPQLLSQWDVLVIKTPTSAYSPAEVDAIVDFVRRGGGLFLVGDHTNVFGSGTYLNPIAERFGLYFRYDATYRLDNLDLSLWHPPALLPHAVVRRMGEFLFATSCSLDSPLLSENVMLGYGLRAIYLDYSETSYFPSKQDKMDDMYPIMVQSGGVRFGKGRVLGFTDSTVFSNFFTFIPGKPELALGSIEWLNRSNGHGFLLRLSLLLGITGLALLLWELRLGRRIAYYDTVVGVGLLTFTLVAGACQQRAALDYPAPQPTRSLDEVAFDGEHGSFLLPLHSLQTDYWSNAQTFYVWMQRVGLVPTVTMRLEDTLRLPPPMLVELNPIRDYTLHEVDGIVDFVRRGGILFVLDSPLNVDSRANQILGPFSMSFVAQRADTLAVLHPPAPAGDWLTGSAAGDTLCIASKAFGVGGAKSLLELPNGAAVLGERDFGRGKVIACGASQIFSTSTLGNTAVTPTARMRSLYQAQYDLVVRVAGIRVKDRYALVPAATLPPAATPTATPGNADERGR